MKITDLFSIHKNERREEKIIVHNELVMIKEKKTKNYLKPIFFSQYTILNFGEFFFLDNKEN
jgi:hypothetical protein